MMQRINDSIIEKNMIDYFGVDYAKISMTQFTSLVNEFATEVRTIKDSSFNTFDSHFYHELSGDVLMRTLATKYASVFKRAKYFEDLRSDSKNGRVMRDDVIKYFTNFCEFLGKLKVYPDYNDYNVIDGLRFYPIDVPELFESKLEILTTLLVTNKDMIKDTLADPLYKYVKLNGLFNNIEFAYEHMIDEKIKYSPFYNSFLCDTMDIKEKINIIKLSKNMLSKNQYYGNNFKRFMQVDEFNAIKSKYDTAFYKKYGKELEDSIATHPLETEYMIENIFEE